MDEAGSAVQVTDAAVQVVQVGVDSTFKFIGMSMDMIEHIVNIMQYLKQKKVLRGGEAKIDDVISKSGSMELFQFATADKDKILDALTQYHVTYSIAPDLNLHDGMTEVFFADSDTSKVNMVIDKLGLGKVITHKDYLAHSDEQNKSFFSNAAPEQPSPEIAKINPEITEQGYIRDSIEFSINKDSIYSGVINGCHVVRVPYDEDRTMLHIPTEYCQLRETDGGQTLLLKLPKNAEIRAIARDGRSTWVSAQKAHDLGFAKSDRIDKAKDYADKKIQQKTTERLMSHSRSKRQRRF